MTFRCNLSSHHRSCLIPLKNPRALLAGNPCRCVQVQDKVQLLWEPQKSGHLGELSLAHTSGPSKEHGCDGTSGVLQASPCPLHGARYCAHCICLANHPLLQIITHRVTGVAVMMSIAITLHQHANGLHDNLLAREESVASIDSVVLVPAPRLPSCASAGSCEPRQGLT